MPYDDPAGQVSMASCHIEAWRYKFRQQNFLKKPGDRTPLQIPLVFQGRIIVRTITTSSSVSQQYAFPKALSHKDFDAIILANRTGRYRRMPDKWRLTHRMRRRDSRLRIFWCVGSFSSACWWTAPPLSVTMLEARQVRSGHNGELHCGWCSILHKLTTSFLGGHSKLSWQNIPELCEKFGDEQCSALADFFLAQIPALKDVIENEGIECDFALRKSFNVF